MDPVNNQHAGPCLQSPDRLYPDHQSRRRPSRNAFDSARALIGACERFQVCGVLARAMVKIGRRAGRSPSLVVQRLGLVAWLFALVYASGSIAACMDCHQGLESIAVGAMAKQIARLGRRHNDAGGCVVCHGGDPLADDKDRAHRGAPSGLTAEGGPADFNPDPGETWVAERSCGQCHEGYAERGRKSVKSTGVGAIERDQCAFAWANRISDGQGSSRFGLYAMLDEDGPLPVVGTPEYKLVIESLMELEPDLFLREIKALPSNPEGWSAQNSAPSCTDCHGAAQRDRWRSGCSVCHMAYGTYQGHDPTIDRASPDTMIVHRIQGVTASRVRLSNGSEMIVSGIPLATCFRCHVDPRLVSTNRIGDAHVHYGGEPVGSGSQLLCQDCHTSIEMHGDGNLPAISAAQIEIRCEDCHGTTDLFPWELPLGIGELEQSTAGASLRPRGTLLDQSSTAQNGIATADGLLLTSRGNPFGNVVRDGNRVFLYSVSGDVHEVTLLKSLGKTRSWQSELSKEVKSAPANHRDMACADCHADGLPTCLGCHDGAGEERAESGTASGF